MAAVPLIAFNLPFNNKNNSIIRVLQSSSMIHFMIRVFSTSPCIYYPAVVTIPGINSGRIWGSLTCGAVKKVSTRMTKHSREYENTGPNI